MVHIKEINGKRYYYKSKRVKGKKNPTSVCLGPVDKIDLEKELLNKQTPKKPEEPEIDSDESEEYID